MKVTEFIKNNTLILDGGMGTMLQAGGLMTGEVPERLNVTHPEKIRAIHIDYLNSGSNVISTNTFGANSLKFSDEELEKCIFLAVENAKYAIKHSKGKQKKWIALDVGPTGKMLKPLGDLDFEDAVSVFSKTISIGVRQGVDLIFIETMSDSYETKAALLAAKECCDLPVFVSCAYGSDHKLLTGADPMSMVALLEGMGADAIGVNCSLGPRDLYPVVEEYLKYASVPVIVKPNAGLPRVEGGNTVYDLSSDEFASATADMVRMGARAVGGCCGTTPEYISKLKRAVEDITPLPIAKKNFSLASSYTHAIEIGKAPLFIGERINPTGKPLFREAVKNGDMGYILKEAIGQEECGVAALDVNLGIPGVDEVDLLTRSVESIQSISALPLQIDSSNTAAMESALRRYNGKAIINSLNGKRESLDSILPLAKKYGGIIIALTLDENGIPKKAEDRVNIAKKILIEAKKYGIDKKDIVFDPLAMAVSADKDAAIETLRAVKIISDKLKCHTSLGISNVSFGLPGRDSLNSSFLAMALNNNLSLAIVNPYSKEIMSAYHSYRALSGLDENFMGYLSHFNKTVEPSRTNDKEIDLKSAIIKGLKEKAAEITSLRISSEDPLDIVNFDIIPALDFVGQAYEKKEIYLPGLLMSAEAAGKAFEVIKKSIPKGKKHSKLKIVLATVKGDVHDIGKNIVRMILENYGYEVIDLGKDVSPKAIADSVVNLGADIVGLSALMTTTLPSMEETIALIKKCASECKIMVGGAVLTEEYATKIGADFYGKDAMSAVRFVENVNKT